MRVGWRTCRMRQFNRLPVSSVHVRRPPCSCALLNVPMGKQPLFHGDPLQRVKPLPVIRVVLAFPGTGRRTRDLPPLYDVTADRARPQAPQN
jgi:hypothetical protein